MGIYNRTWSVILVLLIFASFGYGDALRLKGTYLQLWSRHTSWTEKDWQILFADLKALNVSDLVIQWAAYQNIRYYKTETQEDGSKQPVIQTILDLADRNHMHLYMGLREDPTYWDVLEQKPREREAYFTKTLPVSLTVADELAPLVQGHSSFQGWYIPEEVVESSWKDPDSRQILFRYLNDVSVHLHQLTPSARIAVSGFTNGESNPDSVEEFWDELLRSSKIDRVFFQDGIGAGKLTLEKLPTFLAAVSKATMKNGRSLQVVVELFEQSRVVDGVDFQARPAQWTRIQEQMKIALPFSPSGLFAFSIVDYMRPAAGKDAAELFRKFKPQRH